MLLHERAVPAAQGFGVVGAEGQLLHHAQPRLLRRRAKARRAGQAAAREDELLYEVRALHIALKQRIVDDDALHAGAPAGFEQTRHGAKVTGPVSLAHGLDHFDGANGVKGRILDVAVILQTQLSLGCQSGLVQALLAKRQLLGR